MIFFNNSNNVKSLLSVVLLTMTGIVFADNKIRRRGIVNSPLLSITPILSNTDIKKPTTLRQQQPQNERREDEDDEGDINVIREQQFWFDCYIPGERNLSTNDMLVGYFYDQDGNIVYSQEKPNGISCTRGNAHYFDIQSSTRVHHARLIIVSPSDDEGDSLFIDYAWLKINGVEVEKWDDNDREGWCLSTEPDDVDTGGWRDNSHWNYCVEDLCFLPNGIVEDGDECFPSSRDTIEFYLECMQGNLRNTQTNDVVTAYFHDDRGNIIDFQEISEGISCTGSGTFFEIQSYDPVDYVRLVIDGGDALWIDRAGLKVNGNTVKRWGSNNDQLGWCLSTESDDVSNNNWGEHSYWGQCEDQICFERNNGVLSGSDCEPTPIDLHQQFWFDCHVPNESYLDTTDRVIADFYDSNGNVIDSVRNNPIRCDSDSENYFEIWSPRRIDSIELMIETPGGSNSDALFIDYAWLMEEDQEVKHWDSDDDWGYCLSTDPDDMNSWNRYWDECTAIMCFKPNEDVVPEECLEAGAL